MYLCNCNGIREKDWDAAYAQVCERFRLQPEILRSRRAERRLVRETFKLLDEKPQCGKCLPELRARRAGCAAG